MNPQKPQNVIQLSQLNPNSGLVLGRLKPKVWDYIRTVIPQA